ncbi:MAG: recJ [Candidatus Nomurabacteria bacterium]|nr:recJ [Candidatus Nomurabacteria bacterium]
MLLERLNLSEEAQRTFLEPMYKLGDPYLFRDMEKAVSRIVNAIQNKEHIGIYADYDCDGIPGAVVLVDFFKVLGIMDHVHVYIPDRHMQGYGVNSFGIDELEKLGVTLMITVDVGITALAEIADAQSRGIDVILTDHHTPLDMLPAAYAVVHPLVGDYPEKGLCGAAVAFMLVRAFVEKYGKEYNIPEGWEKWLLDLVGFATLSDMVPLVNENRVLAYFGMMVMKKTRRVGLQVLFAANSINTAYLTESDLTFTVAPRLNAASRMASPLLAFELLSTDDRTRAMELVKELTAINDERKTMVARIVKDAHSRLNSRELPEIVVIGDLSWRPAVLGLVAGKLADTYGKSFFVWGEGGDGTLKGSCRMLSTHNAATLMQGLPEGALIHGGGHSAAGGFAATKDQIHGLEQLLNDVLNGIETVAPEEIVVNKPIALPLSVAAVRHLQAIRSFAPFGVGNAEPVFLFENVTVQSTKKFGKAKEHIECIVSDSTGIATAFTFFVDDAVCKKISTGNVVSILGTLEAGWRGGVRIRIKDIHNIDF